MKNFFTPGVIPQFIHAVTAFGGGGKMAKSSGAATVIFPPSNRCRSVVNIGSYAAGFGALLKLSSMTPMTMYNQSSNDVTSSENSPEGRDYSEMMQPFMPAAVYFKLLHHELNHRLGMKSFSHNEARYNKNDMVGALLIGGCHLASTKEFDKFRGHMTEELGHKDAFIYDGGNLYSIGLNSKIEKLPPEYFYDFISADTMHDQEQMNLLDRFFKEHISGKVRSLAEQKNFNEVEGILQMSSSVVAENFYRSCFVEEAKRQGVSDLLLSLEVASLVPTTSPQMTRQRQSENSKEQEAKYQKVMEDRYSGKNYNSPGGD